MAAPQRKPDDAERIRRNLLSQHNSYTESEGNPLHPSLDQEFNTEQYHRPSTEQLQYSESGNTTRPVYNPQITVREKITPQNKKLRKGLINSPAQKTYRTFLRETRQQQLPGTLARTKDSFLLPQALSLGSWFNSSLWYWWVSFQVPIGIMSILFFILMLQIDDLLNNPDTWWEQFLSVAITEASKLSKISEWIFGFSAPDILEAVTALFFAFWVLTTMIGWTFLAAVLLRAMLSSREKANLVTLLFCFAFYAVPFVNMLPLFSIATHNSR